jgi:hypothetical protein
VKLPREFERESARLPLHIGRVNYRKPPRAQPFCGNKAQHLEGIFRRSLIAFVIRNKAAAKIGRQNLSRPEMLLGKAGFAAARSAD